MRRREKPLKWAETEEPFLPASNSVHWFIFLFCFYLLIKPTSQKHRASVNAWVDLNLGSWSRVLHWLGEEPGISVPDWCGHGCDIHQGLCGQVACLNFLYFLLACEWVFLKVSCRRGEETPFLSHRPGSSTFPVLSTSMVGLESLLLNGSARMSPLQWRVSTHLEAN